MESNKATGKREGGFRRSYEEVGDVVSDSRTIHMHSNEVYETAEPFHNENERPQAENR